MAFFSLWILGFLICILSVIYLWKQAVALRKSLAFQKQFAQLHKNVVKQTFNQGWMWLEIVLVFFMLSVASQSDLFAPDEGFAPEILTFLGISIYCASRALAEYTEGQILFYPQGFVWKTSDFPYSSIRSIEESGNRYEISSRKETILISRSQGEAVKEHREAWRKEKLS